MYSREDALQKDTTIIVESLSAPVITISASGHDSVLVYTRDNSLRHYVFSDDFKTTRLMLVGQIAFHGIIRAPLRVRAVTWILAEDQYGIRSRF